MLHMYKEMYLKVLLVGSIGIIANAVSPMQNTPSHEADSEFAQFQKEVETIQKI